MSEENTNTSEETLEPEVTETPSEDPTPTLTPDPYAFDEDNILLSVKNYLGLLPTYTPFDARLIIDINTALSTTNQLGVGVQGYTISQQAPGSWSAFLANELADNNPIHEVKTYVAKKTQMMFDPPTSGILMNAMEENLKELEWRICCHKETP